MTPISPAPAAGAGPANAAAFDEPHWRVIACGFDTERWFNDGQAVGTGGIANPQPTRLPAGQFYYRLTSSTSTRAAQLGSGWWLDFEQFSRVRQFAQSHGYRLSEAARLMLALPYTWPNGAKPRLDRLVRALLVRPLRAWTGIGRPAQGAAGGADAGTRWIPTQYVAIRQLYVPGLATPGANGQPLFESVFGQPVQVGPLD